MTGSKTRKNDSKQAKKGSKTPQKRSKKGQNRPKNTHFWLIKVLKRTAFYGFTFTLAFVFFALLWIWQDFPDINQISPGIKRQSIVYLNRNRAEIGRHGDLAGDSLESEAIPTPLKHALFAIEDSRFMSHVGIDFTGIFRALYRNLKAGHIVQGGSTITQQIAKNVFLTSERSLKRKLQEFIAALLLEKKFTKNQLLAIYFNRSYFGSGLYGVNAAAQEYFGIPATRLTLAQSCVLVSLLKAPSRLSPFNRPEQAKKRAQLVAHRLLDLKYISEEQHETLLENLDNLQFQPRSTQNNTGYFIDVVRKEVKALTHSKKDLIVLTTLNTQLQKNASHALSTAISKNGATKNVSQGAFAAMQVDGAIAALIGGTDYNLSPYNRAWQAKRQLGSLFKLFVYCAGLEAGIQLQDKYSDTPPIISGWRPRNYGWRQRGLISVLDGFTYSVNAIAVRIAHQIGIKKVTDMAQRFGLTQPFDQNLSTALGSGSASLLDITASFASFGNAGRPITPYTVLEIWDTDGKRLYKRPEPPKKNPLISESVLENMRLLLYRSNKIGTGRRAYIPGFSQGSKTGTSQNFKDAWFVGFTPNLVAGVWVGNDNEAPMAQITGGRLPAQIWKAAFLKGLPAHKAPATAQTHKKKSPFALRSNGPKA